MYPDALFRIAAHLLANLIEHFGRSLLRAFKRAVFSQSASAYLFNQFGQPGVNPGGGGENPRCEPSCRPKP